jgi:hypothetical protein
MRTITIWYDYAGPEEEWRRLVGDFIAGINGDPEIAGKFTYQVTTADDSRTRVHWGRWDNQDDAVAQLFQEVLGRAEGADRQPAQHHGGRRCAEN